MNILAIYCCGGMGKEIADLIKNNPIPRKIIFVDDNYDGRIINDTPVYSYEKSVEIFGKKNLSFIVTSGEPKIRENIYSKLIEQECLIETIKHQHFTHSSTSTIKEGCILHIGSIVTCDVTLGKGCLINKGVVIGHDVTINDFSVVSPNASVGGNSIIGSRCYIGSGAIIKNGITIGDDSIIGMGTVVLKNVEKKSVMVGNPAKLIRTNDTERVFQVEVV